VTIKMVTRYGGVAVLSVVFEPVPEGAIPGRVLVERIRMLG